MHCPCVRSWIVDRKFEVCSDFGMCFFCPSSFFFFDVHEDKRKRHRSPPSFREKEIQSTCCSIHVRNWRYRGPVFFPRSIIIARSRELCNFICFLVLCFSLKKGDHLVDKNPGLGPATLCYKNLLVSEKRFELSVLSRLLLF